MSSLAHTSSSSPTSMFSSPSPLCSATSTSHRFEDGTIFAQEMTIYQKNGTSFIPSQNSKKLMVEVTKRFNELRREIVVIQISKENDIFFSFSYQIDCSEFEKLQNAQQLSISFQLFPEMLKSLLDKCVASSSSATLGNNTSNEKSSHILYIEFPQRTRLQLEIIERDKYQDIRRLAFTLPAASEEDIRNKYRDIYQRFRQESERLNGRIATFENDVRSLAETNSELIQNYNRNLTSQEQSAHDKIREMERAYREEKDKWLESERSLKSKLTKLQLEVQNKEDALKCERQESGHSYSELKEKYSQELSRKNARIKELEERNKQLNSEQEYQKGLREKSSQALKKNELDLDATKKDLNKANEIIRKLQEEVKSGREKLEILNQVTHKQEANLGVKECTLEKVSCEFKICLQQLTKKKREMEQLEADLESFRSKCSQSELQIKANKVVIGKLNEQLELQAKTIEKLKNRIENASKVPKSPQSKDPPLKLDRNSVQAYLQTEREVARKKSALSSRPQIGGKNVDFFLDEEEQIDRSKLRASLDDCHGGHDDNNDAFEHEHNLKNHLFMHIKERPQFREVNLRTNQKANVGLSNGNVIASSRRTHMY